MVSNEVLIGLWAALILLVILARRKLRLLLWVRRARARRLRGDWKGVETAYSEAIKLAPRVPLAYNQRAVALAHQHMLSEARRDLDKALELDPRHGLALCNRGSIRARQGDLHGAIDDLAEGAELVHGDKAQEAHMMYRVVEALLDLEERLEVAIATNKDAPGLEVITELEAVTVRWTDGTEPQEMTDFVLTRMPPGSRVDTISSEGGRGIARFRLPECEEPSGEAGTVAQ